jgi:predicted Co/Zn/Cd cation transporter (cation efflux family)
MVALVVLLSIAVPVRMALGGLLALLNRAPSGRVVAGMEALVRAALAELPVARLWVRAIQPGRTAYVVVHVLLPQGTPLDLTAADRLRGAVIAALGTRHAPLVAEVVFTAVEAYAAPTTGYPAPPAT